MENVERFLRLDGVQGTSKVAGYAGWIDLLEADLGATKIVHTGSGSYSVESKMTFTVKMRVDAAYSSRIWQLATSGAVIPKGDLDIRSSGKDAFLLVCHFTGMDIRQHLQVEKGEEGAPFHKVTFGFTTITSESC